MATAMFATNSNQYFATLPTDELGMDLIGKARNFYDYMSASGRMDLYRRCYNTYYSSYQKGSARVHSFGAQGEYKRLRPNHYRNILLHMKTLAMNSRAEFEVSGINSDYETSAQVILAGNLLDYYMKNKKLERRIGMAVESSLNMSEAFIEIGWDPTLGSEVIGKTQYGTEIREGDVYFENHASYNVIRDFSKTNPLNHDWLMPRVLVNKYTLAAQYPQFEEEILKQGPESYADKILFSIIPWAGNQNTDDIPVFRFRHERTASVPDGRQTLVLADGTVIDDGELPYKHLYIFRVAPYTQDGTTFGYSVSFDLLPLQEVLDILYSTVITNISTFGVQNILSPAQSNLALQSLSGGLNLVEYDAKYPKPEPMALLATPAEVYGFITRIEDQMQTLSGVNSVARGDPAANLKSGAAMALVQSMAVQFSFELQESIANLIEDLGTGIVELLQDYAIVPRIAEITGISNRSYLKEFSNKDIDKICRVNVGVGNPLTSTVAGKVNLAENLIQNNMIDTPEQYITVMNTGRLEPLLEGKQAEFLLIKDENESLQNGELPKALITDNHARHVVEHKAVLASTSARANPLVVQNVLAHIQDHINLNNQMTPEMSQMLKEGMAPVQAPPPGPPTPSAPQLGAALNATPPVVQSAQDVQLPSQPNMPTNPLTGQKANPQGARPI